MQSQNPLRRLIRIKRGLADSISHLRHDRVKYRQARAPAHWCVCQIDVASWKCAKKMQPGITSTAQIFVHDEEWKACGAEMEDIGVGDALIVISCHGNRSE